LSSREEREGERRGKGAPHLFIMHTRKGKKGRKSTCQFHRLKERGQNRGRNGGGKGERGRSEKGDLTFTRSKDRKRKFLFLREGEKKEKKQERYFFTLCEERKRAPMCNVEAKGIKNTFYWKEKGRGGGSRFTLLSSLIAV